MTLKIPHLAAATGII